MGVESIIQQIEVAKRNLEAQANVFLKEGKKQILDYVRLDQLFELGEDADNTKLEPYTPFTRAVKISQGKNPNVVTLFDEGDYYRGFDFNYRDGLLDIFSKDSKSPELIEKYGNRIDDLNKSKEEKVNTNLEENLVEWVLKSVKI